MAAPIAATLVLRTKQFTTGISKATKGVGALGGAVAKLGGIIAKISLAFVALGGVIAALILRQAALIDRIGKVAKTTGIAAETLQKFSFAAELAGVSTDQAQVALRRFSRRLGEAQKGTGELAPTLRRLGIELRDSNGEFKSAEEVLFELSDAIKNTEGASARLSIAFKAFDSEGAELVSVLNQGGDAMRAVFEKAEELGAVLSGEAIQGVERFNDAMLGLGTLINGIANTFVAALSPALTQATLDFTNFLVAIGKEKGDFEDFGAFLKDKFLDIVAQVIGVFGKLTNVLISITNAVINLARALDVPGLPELSEEALAAKERLGMLESAMKNFKGGGFIGRGFSSDIDNLKRALNILEEGGVEVENFRKRLDGLGFFEKLFGSEDTEQLFADVKNKIAELIAEVDTQTGDFAFFDVQALQDYILGLKEVESKGKDANKPLEETFNLWSKITEALRNAGTSIEAFNEQVFDMEKVLEDVATRLGTPIERLQKTIEDGLVKGVEIFEDTLTDAILTGKASFSDLGDHIKQVLAKALVQKFISGPILSIFGLAKGGPANAGQPYIVGEEGPELFVPRQSGTVVPNHEMTSGGSGMGGGTTIINNISAIDTRSFQQRLAESPEYIYNLTTVGARRQPA